MLYYFAINTCIVTTVSGVSDTLARRATMRLQLVYIFDQNEIYRIKLSKQYMMTIKL